MSHFYDARRTFASNLKFYRKAETDEGRAAFNLYRGLAALARGLEELQEMVGQVGERLEVCGQEGIARGAGNEARGEPAIGGRECPHCGAEYPVARSHCEVCGAAL